MSMKELHLISNRSLTSNLTDFAACATSRTFTAPFVCRPQRLAMNTCMIARATQAEQDAAREEWFATMDLRRQEREAKEARRKEQEKFHREWWGLDDKGQRVLKTGSEDERKKDQGWGYVGVIWDLWLLGRVARSGKKNIEWEL
ncbi:hypothetical protein LTR66_013849 [Elasticomyces elasticus]|nr:hypothetical protein LTR66_013849 [Elasticomyces elasticus]